MIVERLAAIRAGKPWFEINEFDDGRIIAMSYHPLSNGGSVAIHEDVTERRKAEQRIAHMAHHDALTDLPNRVHFREEMTEALGSVADGGKVAVLYIDLDHCSPFASLNGRRYASRRFVRGSPKLVRPTAIQLAYILAVPANCVT